MNKIKLLYDVTRTMKNLEKIDGLLQLKVSKDQKELFQLRNKFEKNEGGMTVSSVLNLDRGQVTRESTTEFDFAGRCQHGPGMLRRMFHGRRDEERCCGIKAMFGKLSLAFGILNSLEVEEKEEGKASLSLDLAQAPEELRRALQEKLQYKNDCLSRHGFLRECHQVQSLTGVLAVTINKDRVIETMTVDLNSTGLDENKEAHTMAAAAEVQFA